MNYNDIAKKLLAKNPTLEATVTDADTKGQYKALETKVTTRLCGAIGKAEGGFIKRHTLIWAIIDIVNGDEEGEELDY